MEYLPVSVLHYGPHPMNRSGGAAVNYWNLMKLRELYPNDCHFGVCSFEKELDESVLGGACSYIRGVDNRPELLRKAVHDNIIPIVECFHIAERIDLYIDPIHEEDAKIIFHQTVHFKDDYVFKSQRWQEVDHIVAPTNFSKGVFLEKGYPEDKVTIIPHGVDTSMFYPHRSDIRDQMGIGDQTVILFASRLELRKGVQEILKAISLFRRKKPELFEDSVFFFWGTPSHPKGREIAGLIGHLARKYPGKIFLIPEWVPYEIAPEIMACGDVFLLPTGSEGFGCGLIEAMATGQFVISSKINNVREIVGDSGLLILPSVSLPPGLPHDPKVPSASDIYRALCFYFKLDEGGREAYRMTGLRKVKREYGLVSVTKRWHALYEEMQYGVSV